MNKQDLMVALDKDKKDLELCQSRLTAIQAGEHVDNCTESGVKATIQGLKGAIMVKEQLIGNTFSEVCNHEHEICPAFVCLLAKDHDGFHSCSFLPKS